MSDSHFNEIIHAPLRLQICAMLETVPEMEFRTIKEELNISDSVMSKHLKVLEEAGYLNIDKRLREGRQRTWLKLSRLGMEAYRSHVRALRDMIWN